MGRKTFGIITVLLIFGLVAAWYYFSRETKFFSTSAFKAVPSNSAIILRIHDLGSFSGKATGSAMLKEYSGLPGFDYLLSNLRFADSLFNLNPETTKYLGKKDLTISYGGKKGNADILFLLELSSMSEKTALTGFINDYFTRRRASSITRKQGEATARIYYWSQGPDRTTFCISVYKGLCVAGFNPDMVMEALAQIDQPVVTESSEFQKSVKTASPEADINIYINHRLLPGVVSDLIAVQSKEKKADGQNGVFWSEIDFNLKEKELQFNGFTFAGDSLSDFMGIFLNQKPGAFDLEKYFPDETSFFLCLNLENVTTYFRDYEALLSKTGVLDVYKKKLDEIDTLYRVNLRDMTAQIMENEAGIVFTGADASGSAENRFFIMKTRSGSQTETLMLGLINPVTSNGRKNNLKVKYQEYRIDAQTSFRIYPMPVTDFAGRVFGKIFANVTTPFFTVYENCLIMGNSFESIGKLLESEVLHETLNNNPSYKEFISNLSQPLSLYCWISPGRALPFFTNDLNAGIFKKLSDQTDVLRKIESAGWQIAPENGLLYNTGKVVYSPSVNNKRPAVWRTHLDSLVVLRPQLVINPENKENREIVVQDAGNNLYLLSEEGRIIWKKQLKGPVMDRIHLVNYYKDKRLQYLFNTAEAIHMLDREGNYIPGYPVSLKSPATNGIGVFDYDRTMEYRSFVACSDKMIYAYDKNGVLIEGWKAIPAEHEVIQPVQFFRVLNKDYLVYSDRSKTYIMDRKGNPRVLIKEDFDHSLNNGFTLEQASGKNLPRLVTTDRKGTVCMIGFDGNIKKILTGEFSDRHFFIDEDLDGDGLQEYIYQDGDTLVIFDETGKLLRSKKFKNKTDIAPRIFEIADSGKKIGISIPDENQVYLFNPDLTDYAGFPIEGSSPFAIGSLKGSSKRSDVIVGTKDCFLNNYLVR